jgi:hypothetical protein
MIAAAVTGLLTMAAEAQNPKVRVGTLTCKGQGKVGMIVGSKETLACTYQPTKGRASSYRGTVTRVGLDVGVKGKSVMVWAVLTTTTKRGPRFLAGNYVGASADASIGVGGGGNLLVGGNNKSVTLQPLSVQGQTGVNLAVGVSEFALR